MRFNNDKPIFSQIAEMLADDIASGKFAPGGRLPSARDLATSLGVNPNTAARALQTLADSGIARPERGTGYYVADTADELLRAERRKRFLDEELPRLFKAMHELNISFEELEARWNLLQSRSIQGAHASFLSASDMNRPADEQENNEIRQGDTL
ncbi:MAG TPA: GntR family transcriptional regulator [Spirochaetales bacterium]|nr:GntR family transcriptional regulator [Spirochaetales bacterium]